MEWPQFVNTVVTMNDEIRDVKLRRAPSGKIYAMWHGKPICDAAGELRYFGTEDDALDFLERCDLAAIEGASAT